MLRGFFKNRILSYYFIVLILFTTIIILFQYNREKHYRQTQLELILDNVTGTTNMFLELNNVHASKSFEAVDSLINIIPVSDLRISLVDLSGLVLFDTYVEQYNGMENHASRPEISMALIQGSGSSIRESATTGKEYFYYARKYNDLVIRAAVEYTFELQTFLSIDKLFVIVILTLFFIVWTALLFINVRFKKTTLQLKQFVSNAHSEDQLEDLQFPGNELGQIGVQIMEIYRELRAKGDKLETDQNKIFRHLKTMEEGIAIYSESGRIILSNDAYVQNANLLAGKEVNSPEEALNTKALKPIRKFIVRTTKNPTLDFYEKDTFKEITINKQNRYYLVRCNIFNDLSYEIIIKDISKSEKNRVLKQQLSSNIAHELRTPVTSIVGYLETIMASTDIEDDMRDQFLDRARIQAERLTELIEHISVINKLEEGPDYYKTELLSVYSVVNEVKDSMLARLDSNGVKVIIDIDTELELQGNKALFTSIFQNLIENTINYAGVNIGITISKYYEDENYHYFRYSNSGNSIPEKHLNRLFERFYRIDEGRARKRGGTGLGLAIVKHSIQFHKGHISVKNLEQGGVEFQFTISKSL